jgi:hypothetical protein
MKQARLLLLTLGLMLTGMASASAEMLALINYESKADQPVRREGIAIMDIDPQSADFGKILMEIPLPSDLVAHHIFFQPGPQQGLCHGLREKRPPCYGSHEVSLPAPCH